LGHKVHPTGFRLGIIRDWQSKWYSDTHYADFVQEDTKLREAITSKYREAAISLIEIDRQAKDVTITLYTARPGIVIGRGGQRVDEMRLYLESLIGKRIRLNIQEIRQPEMDAYLVAKSVAEQIERRIAYRRAMKQAIFRTIQAGAKGIKISCAGRLGNAEIARRQTSHQGQVPLHTLRADIDYGFTEAHTTLGRIGVKVWIYKGQILPEAKVIEAEEESVEAIAEIAEVAPTAEPEEEPVKAVTEIAEMAPTAEPEEEPVEAIAEIAEVAPTAEPEEEPVEAIAESAEMAPAVEPEKEPAKPRARKTAEAAATAEPEEKPAKPRVRKTAEAAATAEPEEKPAKPRARKTTEATTTEPEEKPAKPRARKTAEATTAEPEEKPTKPRARKTAKATTAAETKAKATESAVEAMAEVEPSTAEKEEEEDAAA
jgi:small subunit ribosomal protein S3